MKSSALGTLALAPLLVGCSFSGAPGGGGGADIDAGGDAAAADAAGEETLVFRRGDGATVADTWLFESKPDEERGDFPTLVIDSVFREATGGDGVSIGALYFDFIGGGPDRVPAGATVEAAELVLVIENLSAVNLGGEAAELFFSLVEWDESTTWSSMGENEGVDPDEDYADTVVGIIPNTMGRAAGTEIEIEVGDAVGDWVTGDVENRGWIMRMPDENTDGVRFFTSDAPELESRPRLTVTFRRP